jgi:hypothetical protein
MQQFHGSVCYQESPSTTAPQCTVPKVEDIRRMIAALKIGYAEGAGQ